MKIIDVNYISQKGDWPTGCENVSSVMLLQYLGVDIDVPAFVDEYLIRQDFETREGIVYGGDPHKVFCGDPRSEDGFGCYAGVIVETLNRIFASGIEYAAVDETGTPMQELLDRYINENMPVIFWACIDMKEPVQGPSWRLTDTGEEFTWISNEHCMLLVGYDEDSYIFNDPYEGHGVVRYPRALVENRHAAQYAMAAAVRRLRPQDENTRELKRIDRTLAYRGGIVDLYKDTVLLPDGTVQNWDYVHHKNGCGACAVPVLPDGRILMIRQYRPAIDETVLELPAGGRDGASEHTAVTAERELLEETGYACREKPVFLMRIQTAVAYCNEYTDIYLCKNLIRVSTQSLDEAEAIRVETFEMNELLQMIRRGELTDAKSAAGILAYAQYLQEESGKSKAGAVNGSKY